MEKKQKVKAAEDSLQKVMQEGEPSVQELMSKLSDASIENQRLRYQMKQMAEEFKNMQIRLGAEEYKHRTEYLWKVIFTPESPIAFGVEFVDRCKEEFIEMMFPTIPEETKPAHKNGDA
jgi:hypothetical protein